MPELIDPKWSGDARKRSFLLLAKHGRNAPAKIATVVFDSDVEKFASVAKLISRPAKVA